MAGLTDEGFTPKTTEEVLNDIGAAQKADPVLGENIKNSADSVLGGINASISDQLAALWEAAKAVYDAYDPNGAQAASLDRLASITGTERLPATPARVTLDVDTDAGLYPAGTLQANPVGEPGALISNLNDFNSTGSGSEEVVFQALETGLTEYTTATVFEISTAVPGWNAINSTAAVTNGTNIETDTELRARRDQEIETQGSSTADAIRADILNNLADDGVTSVSVFENTGLTTDANGIPGKAFEAIVRGPDAPTAQDDEKVAEQIAITKPVGIEAFGSTNVIVTNNSGQDVNIGFTRPTEIDMILEVDLQYAGPDYPGDATVAAELELSANAFYQVGFDVNQSKIAQLVFQSAGVFNVTSVAIGSGTPAVSPVAADYPISFKELGRFSALSIAITSVEVTP